MSETELLDRIYNGESQFTDEIFTSNISLESINSLKKNILFRRCRFERKLILRHLYEIAFAITFYNCEFEKVEVENCDIDSLTLTNAKKLRELKIHNSQLNHLKLAYNAPKNVNYLITQSTIKYSLDCSNINNSEGSFTALINLFDKNIQALQSTFSKSSFKRLELMGNLGETNFMQVNIKHSSEFLDVTLGKSYFNNSTLGGNSVFNNCQFESNVSFRECGNTTDTLSIQQCVFKGQTYFTQATFNKLEITDTTFDVRSSFDGLKTNTILLHLVNFNKAAFFDDIKVLNIEKRKFFDNLNLIEANKWRRTLRQIKQELQKTENRIDYNRFRSYELSAYYRELKCNGNSNDRFILWATKHVTGFDHSWRKALAFTLIAAFLFYSLFFISEDIGKFEDFNLNNFIIGYFRFLLVTDFYNPLSEGRTYIANDGWNHIVSWFIFILGKIVVAFGIYEMIQAFRKFKA